MVGRNRFGLTIIKHLRTSYRVANGSARTGGAGAARFPGDAPQRCAPPSSGLLPNGSQTQLSTIVSCPSYQLLQRRHPGAVCRSGTGSGVRPLPPASRKASRPRRPISSSVSRQSDTEAGEHHQQLSHAALGQPRQLIVRVSLEPRVTPQRDWKETQYLPAAPLPASRTSQLAGRGAAGQVLGLFPVSAGA